MWFVNNLRVFGAVDHLKPAFLERHRKQDKNGDKQENELTYRTSTGLGSRGGGKIFSRHGLKNQNAAVD